MKATSTVIIAILQWGQRNEILHGNDNELLGTNKQQKFKRYMELRNNKYQMLRRCDHHMVEHPISDVIKWSRQHMSAILRNLEEMHKQYLRELKIEEEGLQPITAFFSPVRAASPPCQGDHGRYMGVTHYEEVWCS
eukprot:scaffold91793_cov86-Cyclotella_meneghiniana.AAC.1